MKMKHACLTLLVLHPITKIMENYLHTRWSGDSEAVTQVMKNQNGTPLSEHLLRLPFGWQQWKMLIQERGGRGWKQKSPWLRPFGFASEAARPWRSPGAQGWLMPRAGRALGPCGNICMGCWVEGPGNINQCACFLQASFLFRCRLEEGQNERKDRKPNSNYKSWADSSNRSRAETRTVIREEKVTWVYSPEELTT